MRFLMTTSKADPPDEKLFAEMGRQAEEMTRQGVLLDRAAACSPWGRTAS